LERRGIPAVLLCSETFLPVARGEARAAGLAGLALVLVGADLKRLDDAQIDPVAERIVDEALTALVGTVK
jgi:hypothetical protein